MAGCLFRALLLASPAFAQGVITTAAGTEWLFTGDGKPALQAPLGDVRGVVAGPNGSFYLADRENGMIMRVDAGGILKVVAGNGLSGSLAADGVPATATEVSLPEAVALDRAGNVYFTEYGCQCVRKVSTSGIISTVAGGGTAVPGDGGPATQASLNPFDIAVDAAGNLFILDLTSNRVRKVGLNGLITTVVGTGQQGFSGDGGPAASATLNHPISLALGPDGSLYIGDGQNNRIRKVTPDGAIATFTTVLGSPVGMTVSSDGSLYVSAGSVYKIAPSAAITLVFKGLVGNPWKISLEASGNVLVADSAAGNGRVWKIAPDLSGTIVAGNGAFHQFNDGVPAVTAFLSGPSGVAVDPDGNLYIADTGNRRIRKVATDGSITTVAGGGTKFPGDGGPGTEAAIGAPYSVVTDSARNVYFTDSTNRVRQLSAKGVLTTIAGGDKTGFGGDGGPAAQASINIPQGIAIDAVGNIYLADTFNQRIRKISRDGTITTVAGHGEPGYSGDGAPATLARLFLPVGVAADSVGNIYVADTQNQRIRKVAFDGDISTVAGISGVPGFDGDAGPAVNAHLQYPNAVAISPDGEIYFSDTLNHRIRKISRSGVITTVSGNGSGFAGDGAPPLGALLNMPRGLAFDRSGSLYIADANNDRVREILSSTITFQVSQTAVNLSAFSGGAVSDAVNVAVSGAVPGVPLSVAFVTNNGVPWLRATPSTGAIPLSVEIAADPLGLAPGSYQGTVTVLSLTAIPYFQNITVTIDVKEAPAPKLSVDGGSVVFTLSRGSPAVTKRIPVFNAGGGSLAFTAAAKGGSWLAAAPDSGFSSPIAPASLAITANPVGLSPGVYSGSVSIVSSTTGERIEVPVALTISAAGPILALSQTGFTLTTVAGAGATLSRSFGIFNNGLGTMSWTATASTKWLAVTPSNGTADAASSLGPAVNVSVDASGLTPGTYYGLVEVSAPSAANTSQSVVVVLNVLPPGSSVAVTVQPASLVFTGVAGAADPPSQDVLVANPGSATLSVVVGRSTVDGKPWFFTAPNSAAAVLPDRPARIVVQPDTRGLDAGVRRGELTLVFSDGSSAKVDLLLVLASRSGCVPTKLLPLVTSPGANLIASALWPVPIEVRVTDDCGAAMAGGSVTASFSDGTPSVNLNALRDGSWQGTWAPKSAGAVKITITAAASTIQGITQFNGVVLPNAGPPLIGAMVNSASLAPPPVAPGDVVTIFGAALALTAQSAATFPLPASLGGTEVRLGGRLLPLLYAGDGQINAVLPFDLTANTSHQVIVRRGDVYSLPAPVSVAGAQPAIFTRDASGSGQGDIFVGAGYADPSNPAKAGDAIVIYAAGLGAVDGSFTAGAIAPLSPLFNTTAPATLTIGGKDAPVSFAGLAPGLVGIYQVNASVPTGVAADDQTQVVLTVAGQSSPPVTMATR